MTITQLNLALVLIGAVVLILGLFSNLLKRFFLEEPLLATLVGIVLGPVVAGIINVSQIPNYQNLLEQAARVTLALGLMGAAVRLPRDFLTKYARPLIVLLGVVMALMWAVTGLLTFAILGLPLWMALLIGATITPTDPVLASTIVTGRIADRLLPAEVKEVLSAESGANDGLAYLFVFLPLYVLMYPHSQIAGNWTLTILLRGVLGGVALGLVLGYSAGFLLRWAESKRTIGRTSLLAYTLSLALVTLGCSYLIGSDGLLAVFVAGVGFSYNTVEQAEEREEVRERFEEAITRFFILPVFVLFGAALPWRDWMALGWLALALAAGVLLVRRLPAVMALGRAMGVVKGWRNSLFIGWFGPIGVGAIYYATVAQRTLRDNQVWTVASLVVFASIIVHGLTATPFTLLYGRLAGRRND